MHPQYVFKRAAPPLVFSSKEVVLHHRRLHAEHCSQELGGVICPCRRSMAAFCLGCRRLIYLVVEQRPCEHAMGLALMTSAPVMVWPGS